MNKVVISIILVMLFWNQAWAGRLKIDVNSNSKYNIIYISGNMDSALYRDFDNPESVVGMSNINQKKETILILDNGGGIVEESIGMGSAALSLAVYIFRITNHPLTIMLNKFCASMCTTLVASINALGEKKHFKFVVRPEAILAYRAAHDNGSVNARVTEKMLRWLEIKGVSSYWLNQNLNMFTKVELTPVDAQELVDENVNFFKQSHLDEFKRNYNDFDYLSAGSIEWDRQRTNEIIVNEEKIQKLDEEARKLKEKSEYYNKLIRISGSPEDRENYFKELDEQKANAEKEIKKYQQETENYRKKLKSCRCSN